MFAESWSGHCEPAVAQPRCGGGRAAAQLRS